MYNVIVLKTTSLFLFTCDGHYYCVTIRIIQLNHYIIFSFQPIYLCVEREEERERMREKEREEKLLSSCYNG